MCVCVCVWGGGGGVVSPPGTSSPNIGVEQSHSRDELSWDEFSLGPSCLEFGNTVYVSASV